MEIPEPKLGDYGIDAFLYKNYKDDLFVFLKYKISLKKELEHNSWFWPSFIAVIVLTIASIYVFGERWFWVAIVVYFAVYYLGLLKSQGYKKIEDAIAEIDGQLDPYEAEIKKKVAPFEEATARYYQAKLEEYFEKNIFKKDDKSDQFSHIASEFAVMLEEAREVNKILITTRIHIGRYERYLRGVKYTPVSTGGKTNAFVKAVKELDENLELRKKTTDHPEAFNLPKA